MRACVNLRDLQTALNLVRPAVGAATLEMLRCVRLDTDVRGVLLTATNLELGISTRIRALPGPHQQPPRQPDATGRRPAPHHPGAARPQRGTAIVNFDALDSFAKDKNLDATVTLAATTTGRLQATAGKRSVTLPTLPPADWPTVFSKRPMTRLLRDASRPLQAWVTRLAGACATDEARPVLCHLVVQVRDGTLVAAATDSYRLHSLTTTIEQPEGDLSLLIHPTALHAAAALSNHQQPVSLYVDKHGDAVEWHTPRTRIRARTGEGEFPPVAQLIPDTSDPTVYAQAHLRNAKAAAGLINDIAALLRNNAPVALAFDADDGTVTVSATDDDLRIDGDLLPGLTLQVPPRPVDRRGFNPKYLAELLQASGDNTTLHLLPEGPWRPAVFRNGQFTGVLMPVRLTGSGG